MPISARSDQLLFEASLSRTVGRLCTHPLSGQKSKFQDIRGDFISDCANPEKKKLQKIGQIWKSGQYFPENLGEARYNPDKLVGPLSGQKVPFQDQASPTITRVL